MDLAREDTERVRAREGDEVDRVKWRILSRCSDLLFIFYILFSFQVCSISS